MTNHLVTALCGLFLAQAPVPIPRVQSGGSSAAPADARDSQDTQDDQDQGGGETEGKEVAPGPEEPEGKAPRAGKDAAPGETHTVVKGDTLWDLSQTYLGSPWYWPKVWAYNPEIANPHWIYPGNLVRFFPAGEEGPSRVEVGEAPNEGPAEGEEETAEPAPMLGGEEQSVRVSSKIGYVPPPGRRWVHQGFATEKEVEESGTIEGSFAESQMLSFPDTAYVKFKNRANAHVGDRYVIFRTNTELEHPRTGKSLGYLTDLIGTMKIIRISEHYATGQIMNDTWDEVHRGDRVGPYSEKIAERITARPNERDLKGVIVTAMVPYLAILGEHTVVVVDRGSADGVQQGNTFTVVRRHDPLKNVDAFLHPALAEDPELPQEDIGSCIALDVKDRLTVCLITRSIREMEKGDRVEMRTASAAGPTARR